jgi:hypothetical protein
MAVFYRGFKFLDVYIAPLISAAATRLGAGGNDVSRGFTPPAKF